MKHGKAAAAQCKCGSFHGASVASVGCIRRLPRFRPPPPPCLPPAVVLQKPDGEKLYDNAERALQGECTVLQRTWEQLSAKTQEAHAHWRKMHSARQMLQEDLHDKTAALSVDESCLTINLSTSSDSPTSSNNSQRPTVDLQEPNHLTAKSQKPPERWKRDSLQLVSQAQHLIDASVKIRDHLSKMLKSLETTSRNSQQDSEQVPGRWERFARSAFTCAPGQRSMRMAVPHGGVGGTPPPLDPLYTDFWVPDPPAPSNTSLLPGANLIGLGLPGWRKKSI